MQVNQKKFYFIALNFLVLILLSVGSGRAAAYTLQDLLDADLAARTANDNLASIQSEYPGIAAALLQIETDRRQNERNCQHPQASADAVRECYAAVADEYEQALADHQNTWNEYWFRLGDAEAAVRSATSVSYTHLTLPTIYSV